MCEDDDDKDPFGHVEDKYDNYEDFSKNICWGLWIVSSKYQKI